jgi:hypothetical protein
MANQYQQLTLFDLAPYTVAQVTVSANEQGSRVLNFTLQDKQLELEFPILANYQPAELDLNAA